jgi:hypothetical protein
MYEYCILENGITRINGKIMTRNWHKICKYIVLKQNKNGRVYNSNLKIKIKQRMF